MTSQGCLMALGRAEAKRVFSTRDPQLLPPLMVALREELGDTNRVAACECWEALHRCFSDGTLDPQAGEPPLNLVILGGRHLYPHDDGHAVVVRPDMVGHIARALKQLPEDWLSKRLQIIEDGADVAHKSLPAELQSVSAIYQTAADEGCCIVFTTF